MRVRDSARFSEIDFENFAIEAIIDFFATLHVDLTVSIKRSELTIECFWTSIFWSEIRSSCEADIIVTSLTADFSSALHIDLSAWDRKDELMTNFFTCCSRLCLRRSSLNLNVCLQYRHVVDFFADSDSVFSVESERFERSDEMIDLNVVVNSNIKFCDFANETDDTCVKINVENVFVKAISKSCKKMKLDWFSNQMSTKSQIITFIHSSNSDSSYKCWHCWKCWMKMTIWLNRLFFEFWWDRTELKISRDANKDNSKNVKSSNICFDCTASEAKNDELIVDIFIDSHVDLTASIKRCELTTNFFACCSRLCLRNIFLKLNVCLQCRHVDNLFVDSDVFSSARDWKVERFSRMTASNAIANSNIDFWDLVSDSCSFCEASDLFSISHTKLTALIERWEFLTNFWASWLRICSYNFSLKLKSCLQILQFIWMTSWFDAFFIDFDIATSVHSWRFELLDETRREKISAKENAFVKTLLKRFNEINLDWVLNHSKARSHRLFDNRFSRFDLRYRCWHCWRCCRKFATSLYSSNSDSSHSVESKISIFWSVDVCFAVFIAFNSTRSAIFWALRFARFWVTDFNSRCSCEENAFVKVISKRDRELKCDCFLNHFQTESLRVQSMYSSSFVLRYRYNSWQCSRFRRKLVTSLNCLIFESEHDKLELKKSISREELKESKLKDNEDIENITKIWEERWLTR